MDEAECQAATDFGLLMTPFFGSKLNERKKLLQLAAVLRRMATQFSGPELLLQADAAERYADNPANKEGFEVPQLEAVREAQQRYLAAWQTSEYAFQEHLFQDIFDSLSRPVALDTWRTPAVLSLAEAAYEERSLPAGTLDPDRLAVLSDALEEAGCNSEEACQICVGGVRMSAWEVCQCETCGGAGRFPNPLLAHLRGPGPHVRGCWAIDLLLGKE